MRPDFVQAYINRGDILMKLNRLDCVQTIDLHANIYLIIQRSQEAQQQYETALRNESDNADLHYNVSSCTNCRYQHMSLVIFISAWGCFP
jgi:Tfp pilus assembly protein PilF